MWALLYKRHREHKKNREFCIDKQIISVLLQFAIHTMREVDRMRERERTQIKNNQIKSTIRELSHIFFVKAFNRLLQRDWEHSKHTPRARVNE